MAVPGSVVGVGKLITPGGQQGPKGDAGTAANVPLADITQNGLLRQNTGKTTDFVDGTNNCQALAPQIWSARLRSFNAIGNPSFEVDQRNAASTLTNPANGVFVLDRWQFGKVGTMTVNTVQNPSPVVLPGTNFRISSSYLNVTLTGQEASLAAGDLLYLHQAIEGSTFRELSNDVHSISLLVTTSVAGLKFGVYIRDSPSTQSIVKLCTVPSANTPTLITLPNLPVFPTGNFSTRPGVLGCDIGICLSAGTTFTAPSADVWNAGNFLGTPGQDNFASKPVNSTFLLAFVQHEPGSVCSTLMDLPFQTNLDQCERYFTKSYNYSAKPGATATNGINFFVPAGGSNPLNYIPFKKTMAIVPTIICYSPSTGAANIVRDQTAGAERAATAYRTTDSGFNGATVTGGAATLWQASLEYTADTGW